MGRRAAGGQKGGSASKVAGRPRSRPRREAVTEVGGCEQRVVSLTYTHYRKKSTHKNWYLIIFT